MRAILVSVDYSDVLALTLLYNRHHFTEVLVVTSSADVESRRVAEENGCRFFVTDAFYDDGADFNKWKALEQGLDVLGRDGWLCLMDADVLWPRHIPWLGCSDDCWGRREGNLYTPMRRMWLNPTIPYTSDNILPPESEWDRFPLHPQQVEWAGYTQIFHASDPVLPSPPWHDISWKHAGGSDSEFQARWPQNRKVRPPFEVLHIGEAGVNWVGRATPRLDGTVPEGSADKRRKLRELIRKRGKGPDRFRHEKLGG